MHEWNYTPEHLFSLTLATDARFSPTDYTNDQIWELAIGPSDPPALSLQTTFGLRARSCRIFPIFTFSGQVISNPAQFYRPIIIHNYYPNYLRLSCKPFPSLNVQIEYWVPASQVIVARSKVTNNGHETCQFLLDWAELLLPSTDGDRMSFSQMELTTVLKGQTSDICPVLFLTGGVQAGRSPYPSLSLSFTIPPHTEQESRWAHASLQDSTASFELVKTIINRNWDAEFALIQRTNSLQLEIITGNQDWNRAFSLSQTIANQLVIHPEKISLLRSYVYSRKPDQGYSRRQDGSDYDHLWNGPTTFDTYFFTNFLLPSHPEVLKELLEHFISTQSPQGEIDWKPSLGGQHSQVQATPLLATLTWKYYEWTNDLGFLREVFMKLVNFFLSWFTSLHDRDNDTIPEWDQLIQTGFEENPLFSNLYSWSAGVDITTVESPDLLAYLHHEGQVLQSMSRLLGDNATADRLIPYTDALKGALDQSWDDNQVGYLYRDRDSHLSPRGQLLGTQFGPGVLQINQEFLQPLRPMIMIRSTRERTQPVQVFIHGTSLAGTHRVDHFPTQRIRWHDGSGFITSEYVYKSIEKIEISGISGDVEVTASAVDLMSADQTLLLPFWAGIPSTEKAKIVCNLSILNKKKFLSPYGLRSIHSTGLEKHLSDELGAMHLPYISLILEGLVNHGFYKKAADVFSRYLKTVINSMHLQLNFHQSYHSDTGKPIGAIDTLQSLIPIGLFLKILGIKYLNPSRIEITHGNPFPWPVTIKYRGLVIAQQEKKTLIVFPDGQLISLDNNHPQAVKIDSA